MYQKIMVPLDGSKLAECVLPHVEDIAKGCGNGEVTLVSVTERMKVYRSVPDPNMPLGQRLLTEATGRKGKQAERYLLRIAKQLQKKGVNVRTEVLLGDPAEEISRHSERGDCDLIIMASHGRSGLSRWTYGSVAEKVFRASRTPVLMVQADGE